MTAEVTPRVGAIALAASPVGRGAFVPAWAGLAGRPVLAWSVDVLDASPALAAVALVVSAARRAAAERLVATSGWRHVRVVSLPRGTRDPGAQLAAALQALDPAFETLAIHGTARPLLAPAVLAEALALADGQSIVAVAAPVNETIKWVDDAGDVRRTLPRGQLWGLQTPIIVPRSMVEDGLRAGLAVTGKADAPGSVLTALLAACANCPVRVVPAGGDLLLRRRADLAPAEMLLRARTAAAGAEEAPTDDHLASGAFSAPS